MKGGEGDGVDVGAGVGRSMLRAAGCVRGCDEECVRMVADRRVWF